MSIVHYIIVRRDLPLGVLAAMLTHAAGESAVLPLNFEGATAVVLEVKGELELHRASLDLRDKGISLVTIVESGGAYNGQLMALGLRPVERETIAPHLESFQTLKTCLPAVPEEST